MTENPTTSPLTRLLKHLDVRMTYETVPVAKGKTFRYAVEFSAAEHGDTLSMRRRGMRFMTVPSFGVEIESTNPPSELKILERTLGRLMDDGYVFMTFRHDDPDDLLSPMHMTSSFEVPDSIEELELFLSVVGS